MQTIITLIAILLYTASFTVLFTQLKKQTVQATSTFKILFYIGTITHIITLNFTVFPNETLQLGFFKVSSLIFCVISIIASIALIRKQPIESLLICLIPFTIPSIIIGEWSPETNHQIIKGSGLISHIVLSILAYSIITLASLQALALAAQESILRKNQLKRIFEFLPPLQTMEKLLFEMILLGFLLLTLSIASGFFFLENMFAQHLVHKTILSIVAWIIFGILLLGRAIKGWRGITATKWTISGFIALMMAYFGSKFVLEIILHRI